MNTLEEAKKYFESKDLYVKFRKWAIGNSLLISRSCTKKYNGLESLDGIVYIADKDEKGKWLVYLETISSPMSFDSLDDACLSAVDDLDISSKND